MIKTVMKVSIIILCISVFISCQKSSDDIESETQETTEESSEETTEESTNQILSTCPESDNDWCSNGCEVFSLVEVKPRFCSKECESLLISDKIKAECAKIKLDEYLKENVVYPQAAIQNSPKLAAKI